MILTVGNVCDIVLAVFFLLEIVRGWYVGLAMRVAHIAVVIASAVLAYAAARAIGRMPLYGVFFVICVVALNQLAKVVRLVDWIPVIGTINKAGGAVLGFVLAFVVCTILFGFACAVIPAEWWRQWGLTQEVIDNTYLLQAFMNSTL
jgi:hypothetical protein